MRFSRVPLIALILLGLLGAEPVASGLKLGQKPGPYTAVVSVGSQRGQLHCFICEAADRPAIIVFARTMSDGLGRLVRGLDKAIVDRRSAEPRAWVTFLSDDQPSLDPKVVKWGQEQAIRNVPLAVYEDLRGPPAYRLPSDADVTVILSVKQKVVRSYTFKSGELTDARVTEVLNAVGGLLAASKK